MTIKMKILLLDNYDSFTYNLLHAVKELGATDVEVVRNDQIELDEVDRFDKIILSPGPGIPEEAGLLLPIIKRYAPTKSILGVCLGHQAIGEAFGARLENLKEVYHGVQTPITILHQDLLFEGLGKEIPVGRYHSWVVSREGFPDCLEITAESQDQMTFNQNIFLLVENFNNQAAQLEIAEEADEIAQKRYQTSIETFMIGKINILDLNDAQQSKDDAKQKHIQELYGFWSYFYNVRSVTLYDFLNDRNLDADFEEIVRK